MSPLSKAVAQIQLLIRGRWVELRHDCVRQCARNGKMQEVRSPCDLGLREDFQLCVLFLLILELLHSIQGWS